MVKSENISSKLINVPASLFGTLTFHPFLDWVKSVHLKNTVSLFSVLLKLWSFSTTHQLTFFLIKISADDIENDHNFERTKDRVLKMNGL